MAFYGSSEFQQFGERRCAAAAIAFKRCLKEGARSPVSSLDTLAPTPRHAIQESALHCTRGPLAGRADEELERPLDKLILTRKIRLLTGAGTLRTRAEPVVGLREVATRIRIPARAMRQWAADERSRRTQPGSYRVPAAARWAISR